MAKFKQGDTIVCTVFGKGFDQAVVEGVFTEKKGKNKGREMYSLKIMNGTATIPVSSEVNYKLKKSNGNRNSI